MFMKKKGGIYSMQDALYLLDEAEQAMIKL
ncbi:hypothetical protein A943_23005 [Bacillus sp. CPSM8]|nr:hypothetical protein A943_23005 [Bacillus sp. CPSM8]KUL15715.1 hypothetical protein LI6934_19215 [Bacillus licheniformis LMG 6934]